MAIDKNEKRRFILWSIGRTNSQVAPGPNVLYPVRINTKSMRRIHRASPAVGEFLKRIVPHMRTLRICLGVVCLSSIFYWWLSQNSVAPQSDSIARRAIGQAGGFAHSTYTSRFVFQNPKIQPSDVIGLIPYFKSIPVAADLDKTIPECVVLDFTAAPKIDVGTVTNLVQKLEHTIIFFQGPSGGQWRATNDIRQDMLQRAKSTKGKQ